MSETTLLRIGILVAGLLLIGAIYFFGRPRKPGQGRRMPRETRAEAADEPTLAEQLSGVTMREPGVSRLVSVDLAEAARLAGAA